MPRGDWVPLRVSWAPSQELERSFEGDLQRSVFAPRFRDHHQMPFKNPLRRWRRIELPPVDAPLLPDEEGYGGDTTRAVGADAHADFTNPMGSPFARDAVQHGKVLRWDDDGQDDSGSAAGGVCADPATCLPPLLHRRRHSSASVSRSRSGGSMLALQSLSSRRLAAAAAAAPEPPDDSPPRGARSAHAQREDMSQASEWLFGSGGRPEFLEHASSWGTGQLAGPASERHYDPLPAGPGHKAGSRASRVRQRLCCCLAPSAVHS